MNSEYKQRLYNGNETIIGVGSSLNAAIISGKCGCIFMMQLKFSASISSTLEPILSEDMYMKLFPGLRAHRWATLHTWQSSCPRKD